MGALIKNEWIKLFGRKSSWIMQVVLVVCMLGMAFVILKSDQGMKEYYRQEERNYEYKGGMTAYEDENGKIISENEFWSEDREITEEPKQVSLTIPETVSLLEAQITKDQKDPQVDKQSLKLAKKELAFYQAYEKQGKQPSDSRDGMSSANFFSHFGSIYVLATLLAVVVASTIIASEFSSGTIKLLLVRPYSRAQILLSKYIVTILYSLLTSMVMAISAFAASFLLPHQGLNLPLSADLGSKTALTVASQLFASNLLLMVLYITIAFFFSAVIRSQALAIGVGMGILFSGSILGQILPGIIAKYDWLKWVIFNMLGLNNQVIDSAYQVGGNLSVPVTIVGIIVYIVLIFSATLAIFAKRDVALT